MNAQFLVPQFGGAMIKSPQWIEWCVSAPEKPCRTLSNQRGFRHEIETSSARDRDGGMSPSMVSFDPVPLAKKRVVSPLTDR